MSDTTPFAVAPKTGGSFADGVEAKFIKFGRLPSVHLLGCLNGFRGHFPAQNIIKLLCNA